jgi:hypothetical protein
VYLRYVCKFSGTDDGFAFPDDFAEVAAYYLAMDLCVSFTQNKSLVEQLNAQYMRALSDARFNGAIERPPGKIEASSWLGAHDNSDEIDPALRGLAGY